MYPSVLGIFCQVNFVHSVFTTSPVNESESDHAH